MFNIAVAARNKIELKDGKGSVGDDDCQHFIVPETAHDAKLQTSSSYKSFRNKLCVNKMITMILIAVLFLRTEAFFSKQNKNVFRIDGLRFS